MKKSLIIVLIVIIVALSGVIVWQNLGNKTPIVNNQPPISGETADWQVYRNEKYSFEIKYLPTMAPQVQQSDATGDFIVFSGNAVSARISVLTGKEYTSLDKFLEETDKIQAVGFEGTPSVKVNKQNNVTVNGYQAVQREQSLEAAGMDDVSTYFLKNGMVFWISVQGNVAPIEAVSGNNLLDISNKMLSTFKFIK